MLTTLSEGKKPKNETKFDSKYPIVAFYYACHFWSNYY